MSSNNSLEAFASTLNDLCSDLPKSRSRCFDIGSWGGCGPTCAALHDGECNDSQELSADEIIEENGEDEAQLVFIQYPCFANQTTSENLHEKLKSLICEKEKINFKLNNEQDFMRNTLSKRLDKLNEHIEAIDAELAQRGLKPQQPAMVAGKGE